MVSTVLLGTLRTPIFGLPPSLRVTLCNQIIASRPFSLTAHRQTSNSSTAPVEVTPSITSFVEGTSNEVLEHVTTIPLGLLDLIHSTGLPWWAVLPASAVLVRGGFVYHFITKHLRYHAQIQSSLVPLVSARALQLSRTPKVQEEIRSWGHYQRLGSLWAKFICTEQSAMKLGRQFGAPRPYNSWRPYASFGVLIIMTEAIRMKCGTRQGLLSVLLSPIQWCWHNIIPWPGRTASKIHSVSDESNMHASSSSGAVNALQDEQDLLQAPTHSSQESYASDIIAAARESTSDPAVLQALSKLDGSVAMPQVVPTYAQHMDSTIHTEGFLWITDLAVVDPYQYFPAIAAILVAIQIAVVPRRRQNLTQLGGKQPIQASLRLTSDAQRWFERLPRTQQQSNRERCQVAPKRREVLEKAPPNLQITAMSAVSQRTPTVRKWDLFVSWRTNIALVVGYISYSCVFVHMPAGILLYFITSMMVGWLQARWLDQRVPIVPAILPCKRSLRLKVRGVMDHTMR
nr:hypothetical protein CFP56_52573 [Quercus suber]